MALPLKRCGQSLALSNGAYVLLGEGCCGPQQDCSDPQRCEECAGQVSLVIPNSCAALIRSDVAVDSSFLPTSPASARLSGTIEILPNPAYTGGQPVFGTSASINATFPVTSSATFLPNQSGQQDICSARAFEHEAQYPYNSSTINSAPEGVYLRVPSLVTTGQPGTSLLTIGVRFSWYAQVRRVSDGAFTSILVPSINAGLSNSLVPIRTVISGTVIGSFNQQVVSRVNLVLDFDPVTRGCSTPARPCPSTPTLFTGTTLNGLSWATTTDCDTARRSPCTNCGDQLRRTQL